MLFQLNSINVQEKHLIINVDVNGTILGEDAAKGEGPEFGALKMMAEVLENDVWSVINAKGEVTSRDLKSYAENKYKDLKKSDPALFSKSVYDEFHQMIEPEFKNKFVSLIGQTRYEEIQANYPKIMSTKGLFGSFQNLYRSLEASNKPYTIIFHTFGTDVKKVRDTMAILAGPMAAASMPYVSFPSVKKAPRCHLIQMNRMPNSPLIKNLLTVENGLFLINNNLYFGYQGANQLQKIEETSQNSAIIETLKSSISTNGVNSNQSANKKIRSLISNLMTEQDPHYASYIAGQKRVMRLHAEGAVSHAADAKAGTKPKPLTSDITGYLSVNNDTDEIIDYFTENKLVFAKDSYKEWVRGQLTKGMFTNIGAKPFIRGTEISHLDFFFDDNVKKRILSVIKDSMITLNDGASEADKLAAIRQQEIWVQELQATGNINSVSTYEAATDSDYFINAVNQVLQSKGERLILKSQEMRNYGQENPTLFPGAQAIVAQLEEKGYQPTQR